MEDDQPKYRIQVDKEKAALNGISEDDIARTMQVASAGLLPVSCTSIPKRKMWH